MRCASFVVQSSTGKCFVQALWYKVVLGSALCKLCGTKYYWEVFCASFVVRSNTGTSYTLHSTLLTPHSTLYTLYTPHSTLYTPRSLLYSPHSALYTVHSTLYTFHSTLQTGNRGNMYCLQAMISMRVFVRSLSLCELLIRCLC